MTGRPSCTVEGDGDGDDADDGKPSTQCDGGLMVGVGSDRSTTSWHRDIMDWIDPDSDMKR